VSDESRRAFLVEVGSLVALGACAGAGVACAAPKARAGAVHVEGSPAGARRALVLSATRAGSTTEVAGFVGERLAGAGWSVDVSCADLAPAPGGYQALVIGSAIRAGRVLPEVRDYVKAHAAALKDLPVACFVVCLTMKDDTPENRVQVSAYLDPLRASVTPVEVGLFAGRMDYAKLAGVSRLMARALRLPEGDFRDWTAIGAWADGVAAKAAAAAG
jgi:menaquinone-dependent protoporphyrinogen oxidase